MPALPFDRRTALTYESWSAANDTLGNRFPGGQSHLFQGAWTDPVTGLAYHRARWYEPRTAYWLSEDPAGTVDSTNLSGFVAHQPNMGADPQGLAASLNRRGDVVIMDERTPNGGAYVIPHQVAADNLVAFHHALQSVAGLGPTQADQLFGRGGFRFTHEEKIRALAVEVSGGVDDLLSHAARLEADLALQTAGGLVMGKVFGLGTRALVGALSRSEAPMAKFLMQEARSAGEQLIGRVGSADAPRASAVPPQLTGGQAWEELELESLGEVKNTDVWRPSDVDINSAAFKVIVGQAKYTGSGQPVGTIVDIAETGGAIEIKGGSSPLDSSYQIRLQTYRATMTNTSLTIRTPRPVNPTFLSWLDRWGVKVEKPTAMAGAQ